MDVRNITPKLLPCYTSWLLTHSYSSTSYLQAIQLMFNSSTRHSSNKHIIITETLNWMSKHWDGKRSTAPQEKIMKPEGGQLQVLLHNPYSSRPHFFTRWCAMSCYTMPYRTVSLPPLYTSAANSDRQTHPQSMRVISCFGRKYYYTKA